MLQHSVMEKILVDRRQLVLEDGVQIFDDLGVALHRSHSDQWVQSMNHGSGRVNIYRQKSADFQAIANASQSNLIGRALLRRDDLAREGKALPALGTVAGTRICRGRTRSPRTNRSEGRRGGKECIRKSK